MSGSRPSWGRQSRQRRGIGTTLSSVSAVTGVLGWASTGFGFLLTFGGLWWTARAMHVAYGKPSRDQIWPWLAKTWRSVVWFLKGSRPSPITGNLSASLPPVSISLVGGDVAVWRSFDDDADLEIKVAALTHNLKELEALMNRKVAAHNNRMVKIEETVKDHHKTVVALDERVRQSEDQDQARMADALPMEALGLFAAGVGQFLILAGTILLAV